MKIIDLAISVGDFYLMEQEFYQLQSSLPNLRAHFKESSAIANIYEAGRNLLLAVKSLREENKKLLEISPFLIGQRVRLHSHSKSVGTIVDTTDSTNETKKLLRTRNSQASEVPLEYQVRVDGKEQWYSPAWLHAIYEAPDATFILSQSLETWTISVQKNKEVKRLLVHSDFRVAINTAISLWRFANNIGKHNGRSTPSR